MFSTPERRYRRIISAPDLPVTRLVVGPHSPMNKTMVCGPDPDAFHQEIRKYIDAGFDHVYIHQVGPDQNGFINFAQKEILPTYT